MIRINSWKNPNLIGLLGKGKEKKKKPLIFGSRHSQYVPIEPHLYIQIFNERIDVRRDDYDFHW